MSLSSEATQEVRIPISRVNTNDSNRTIDMTLPITADIESQALSPNAKYKQSYIYKVIKYLAQFKILHIPILNWSILSIFVSLLYKLIYKYETLYVKSPLLTFVTSNTLLFGLSDTLAQSISCFYAMSHGQIRLRSQSTTSISLGTFRDQPDESFYTDYGDTSSLHRHRTNSVTENYYQQLSEQTDKDIFNFHRFVGFIFWGFLIAFCQRGWYWVLNHFYNSEPTFVSALERVLSDQLVYSPISLFAFFSYSNFVLEGGDKITLSEKISKIYFSTLAANYMVWPLVQFINFLVMPKRFQVPFSSSSMYSIIAKKKKNTNNISSWCIMELLLINEKCI